MSSSRETSRFPDPNLCDNDEGLIAISDEIELAVLIDAYRHGIFPWPTSGLKEVLWFSPPSRFILEFKNLHIPKTLLALRRKTEAHYRFSIDEDFSAVIRTCSRIPRRGQRGTWITKQMIAAYENFHEEGFAHSVEVWEGSELVGGLYGVDAGGAFCGESMFSLKPGVSKLALLFLIDHLRARGLEWIDAQTKSEHLSMLGAKEMPRAKFLILLRETLLNGKKLFSP